MKITSDISVTSLGNRVLKKDGSDKMKEAADLVLADLTQDSNFFNENPSRPLPEFEQSEVELGSYLGKGEFGIVFAVSALKVKEPCNCPRCLRTAQEVAGDSSPSSVEKNDQDPPKSIYIEGKNEPRPKSHARTGSSVSFAETEERGLVQCNSGPDDIQGGGEPHHPHHVRNRLSSVTFAEEVKELSTAEMDAETEETEKYETISDYDEVTEAEDEDFHPPECILARAFMSAHSIRDGMARYAVKKLKDGIDKRVKVDAAIDLACEAKFLASISHSNIVRLRGTVGTPGTPGFFLIMDRLYGCLDDKIVQWQEMYRKRRGKFGVFGRSASGLNALYLERLSAAFDIARGMRHLHKKKILYRDIKPENIGVDVRGDMRIFDFGLAKELKPKDLVAPPEGYEATGLTGSRRYMAPEVVRCLPYGFSADVYGYGILFWQIFALKSPFANYDASKLFDQVTVGGKRPHRLGDLSSILNQMMEDCWADDRSRRPTFRQICQFLQSEIIDVSGSTTGLVDKSLRSYLSLYNLSERSEN